MTRINCGCNGDCTGLAIVASVVIAIITGILSGLGLITLTPAFLWVLLGISVVYLAFLPINVTLIRNSVGCACVSSVISALIYGELGTILLSIILLAEIFVVTSPITAILAAGLLGFFSLLITSTACLVRCAAVCAQHGTEY